MSSGIVEEHGAPLLPGLDSSHRGDMGTAAPAAPPLAFVIDDQEEICSLVVATLKNLGIECVAFPSAKPAIASLDRRRPAVIFLDVALDQSDAIDVIKGLSDKSFTGTVQLMSGSRPSLLEAIERIAKRHGLTLCAPLQKPVTAAAIGAVAQSLGLGGTVPIAAN
jgi:DNA-binding NtrC family response regulator